MAIPSFPQDFWKFCTNPQTFSSRIAYRVIGIWFSEHDHRRSTSMGEIQPGEDTASHWFKLGNALASGGQYEEAVKALDKAIELNPKDSEVWNNRGIVLFFLKKSKEAIWSFERSTTIDPRNAEAWYNRGIVLCSLERYEDAVVSLEKALEIDPQSAIVWHNKGVALKHLGRDNEARFAFMCAGRLGMS